MARDACAPRRRHDRSVAAGRSSRRTSSARSMGWESRNRWRACGRVVVTRSNSTSATHILGGEDLVRVSRLRRLVRRLRPHVIQAHGGEAMKVSVLARVDVPIVYRRIGGAPPALRSGWRRYGYQRLVRRTARVVAVAAAVRRESMVLLRIPPERIVTIPNAVDAHRLHVYADPSVTRKELGIDGGAPVFLSMGALSWEKDPPALLRVAAEALRRLPDAVYVVLGDGPMRSRMEAEVSSLGLHDRMRMLGVRTDVPDLLSMADALLFASRPDGMEGMPASLIEAGMLGTPSVAYDVAGVGRGGDRRSDRPTRAVGLRAGLG